MKKALTYWRTHEKLELILNRAISLVLPFLLVPILLQKIDLKTYGLFILISGFASVISFTDFGISNILVREISAILEDRKDSELSNLISNSLRILICSAFFIIFTGVLVAGLTNWEVFLKISPEEVLQFKSAVVLASLSIGLSVIGAAAGKILLGLGLNRQHSRFLLVSNFTTAIGIIISAQFPHPLSPMVLAQLGIPALIGILKLIFMMREQPTLKFRTANLNSETSKKIMSGGGFFLFLQICAMFSYELDSLIVGHILNTQAVSELSITWKAISIPSILIASSYLPLWSKAAKINLNRDSTLLYNSILTIMKQVLFTIVPISLLILFFGKHLISSWTNQKIIPGTSLLSAGIIWLLLSSVMQPLAYILNGMNLRRFMIISTGSFAVLNVILTLLITEHFNTPSGALWANSMAVLPTFFFPFAIMMKRWKNQQWLRSNGDNYILRQRKNVE